MAKVMYRANGYKPDENGIRGNDYISMSNWASKIISPFSEERRLLRSKWNKTDKKIEWFEYLYAAAKRKKAKQMAKKKTTQPVNFKGLLSDMKKEPKDKKGKFKDRDFAKYVSRKLAELRSASHKKAKQLKIKFKKTKKRK